MQYLCTVVVVHPPLCFFILGTGWYFGLGDLFFATEIDFSHLLPLLLRLLRFVRSLAQETNLGVAP
jgi:hypothetical protein